MIVLCKACFHREAEELTGVATRPCDVCGNPNMGSLRVFRTDPRTPHEALMNEVDDICEWLDYFPTLEDLEASLRKLNGARIRYAAAKAKERNRSKAVSTTPSE